MFSVIKSTGFIHRVLLLCPISSYPLSFLTVLYYSTTGTPDRPPVRNPVVFPSFYQDVTPYHPRHPTVDLVRSTLPFRSCPVSISTDLRTHRYHVSATTTGDPRGGGVVGTPSVEVGPPSGRPSPRTARTDALWGPPLTGRSVLPRSRGRNTAPVVIPPLTSVLPDITL